MPLKTSNSITIFQWNARSISTNAPYLVQHLADNNYQVLILQSLNVCKSKLPKLPNFYYPPVHQQADEKDIIKVAIYIREGTDYCIRPSPASNSPHSLFSCAVTVRINNNVVLNVVSVYLPKGPDNINTEWLIAGDFNAHSPSWEKDCLLTTSNRLVENIIDSSLYMLNDGSVT